MRVEIKLTMYRMKYLKYAIIPLFWALLGPHLTCRAQEIQAFNEDIVAAAALPVQIQRAWRGIFKAVKGANFVVAEQGVQNLKRLNYYRPS